MRSTLVLVSFAVGLLSVSPAQAYSVAMPTQGWAEAAIEIMKAGGNAADAIVAGAFALNVTQPYNMGIGGGGFMLLADHGKVNFWNSREIAPAATTPDQFLDKDGKPIPYYPQRVTGPKAVGVPGTVAGLYEMHRNLGSLRGSACSLPRSGSRTRAFP